jgi:hypothetical protein
MITIKDIEVNEYEIINHKNNKTMSETTEKEEMTIEEMEAKIAKMKEKKRKARENEKLEYVKNRDENIESIIEESIIINELVKKFKEKVAGIMVLQSEKLTEYGQIRSNSKGGFSITNALGDKRIVRRRDTEPNWDERAEKGVTLLRDYLGDVVKKRDVKTYNLLMGFLVKNEKGDLEHSRVMELLKHEDYSNDERWTEGIRLVKEGYSNVMKGYGYQFLYRPNEGDKWSNINLSFSSI